MEKFDYKGRNYKVVNGMVHTADTAMLHPCYRGDNVMLDAFVDNLDGVLMYQRPDSIHTHGHQKGKARVRKVKFSEAGNAVDPDAAVYDAPIKDAMRISYKVWLHIEKLQDPDTENEKYENVGFPVELAHVRSIIPAEHLVDLIENEYKGEVDDI